MKHFTIATLTQQAQKKTSFSKCLAEKKKRNLEILTKDIFTIMHFKQLVT